MDMHALGIWLSSSIGTGRIRRILLSWAQSIVRMLEKPEEVVFRQAFESHTHSCCLRLAVDLRVFHILKDCRDGPISSRELAKFTGADAELLIRIMRMLTALGYAREMGERQYLHSPLGNALSQPALEACLVHSYEHAATVDISLPGFFAKNGYHSPEDGKDGPFQYALKTDKTYFDFIHSDPRKMRNFNTFMTGNRNARVHWTTWFPVRRHFLSEWTVENENGNYTVLLVDMGGGNGHDLQRFLQVFPESKSHLVLQDLPGTIQNLQSLEEGITSMVHDIFQPQPIVGAKVYYTHFLLHDFSDDKCREILRHVSKAMSPSYSRLLLNEAVLPERGCPSFFAAADITMMSVLSAKMRSKRQWTELVESAGLQVVRIWDSPYHGDNEGIVEAIIPPLKL